METPAYLRMMNPGSSMRRCLISKPLFLGWVHWAIFLNRSLRLTSLLMLFMVSFNTKEILQSRHILHGWIMHAIACSLSFLPRFSTKTVFRVKNSPLGRTKRSYKLMVGWFRNLLTHFCIQPVMLWVNSQMTSMWRTWRKNWWRKTWRKRAKVQHPARKRKPQRHLLSRPQQVTPNAAHRDRSLGLGIEFWLGFSRWRNGHFRQYEAALGFLFEWAAELCQQRAHRQGGLLLPWYMVLRHTPFIFNSMFACFIPVSGCHQFLHEPQHEVKPQETDQSLVRCPQNKVSLPSSALNINFNCR